MEIRARTPDVEITADGIKNQPINQSIFTVLYVPSNQNPSSLLAILCYTECISHERHPSRVTTLTPLKKKKKHAMRWLLQGVQPTIVVFAEKNKQKKIYISGRCTHSSIISRSVLGRASTINSRSSPLLLLLLLLQKFRYPSINRLHNGNLYTALTQSVINPGTSRNMQNPSPKQKEDTAKTPRLTLHYFETRMHAYRNIYNSSKRQNNHYKDRFPVPLRKRYKTHGQQQKGIKHRY